MADRAIQSNLYPRIYAPTVLDDAALRRLRGEEAERCVVFASWHAIEPSEDVYDEHAVDELRQRLMRVGSLGCEPVLCFYRGEDPAWFTAKGGWQKEDNLRCFLRYVGRVTRTAGHLCSEYITFYEPNALLWESSGPRRSLPQAVTELSHMACTHVRAFRLIRDTREQRQLGTTAVGFALRLCTNAEVRGKFLRGRLPVGAALYEKLPLLAMARGEFHLPVRNTLRVQPGIWADFIAVSASPKRCERCCAQARTLTGVECRILEE